MPGVWGVRLRSTTHSIRFTDAWRSWALTMFTTGSII
jgi:hypothetical protein